MDTDSNKITWVVVIIAAVAIMGGLFVKFVPDITSQIQSYVQTVTDNSSGTVVDSSSNSDFSYSEPNTADDTISITGYNGKATNLIIPQYRKIGSVKYKITAIGNYAFENNTSIKQVTIPDSVRTIGIGAFAQDSNLKSLTLGSDVTSIGKWSFQYTALTSVDFPASLKSIGGWAFANTSISAISFKSPVDLSPSAFMSNNLTNVTLPKGSSYVTASADPGHATFDSNVTVTVK